MKNIINTSYRHNYLKIIQERVIKKSLPFLIICSFLFFHHISTTAQTVDWQLVKDVDGVEFYFSISNCSEQRYLILKVKNTNAINAVVNWNLQLIRDGFQIGSIASMEPEGLAPNSELIGDCNNRAAHLVVPIDEDIHLSQIALVATVN